MGFVQGLYSAYRQRCRTSQENKKLRSYIHVGSYSSFFPERKPRKLEIWEKKKWCPGESPTNTENEETTTRKTNTEKYFAYVQMHILYT